MTHARSHFKGATAKHDGIIIDAFTRVVIEPHLLEVSEMRVGNTILL